MRIPLLLILLAVPTSLPLDAEQPERAAEVYGLIGSYRFGNKSNVLKGDEWNPQAAGGPGSLQILMGCPDGHRHHPAVAQ